MTFVAVCAAGFKSIQSYVEKRVVFPTAPPKLVLLNRPAWMSDHTYDEILKAARPMGTYSAFDHQLLVDTYESLKTIPWVKQVRQVRRTYDQRPGDTLEIDCEFRTPVALVAWGNYFWLVDGDGNKLPEQYTAQQVARVMRDAAGHTTLRIIDGVAHPPVESGMPWPGEDLAAGLQLVKILFDKPYADDVTRVDVSNFAGRRSAKDAQLVLYTKYRTEIRWGRPPGAEDYFIEVPTAQKLQRLQQAYDQYQRVDAGQSWIDIRFDRVTRPSPGDATTAHADVRP